MGQGREGGKEGGGTEEGRGERKGVGQDRGRGWDRGGKGWDRGGKGEKEGGGTGEGKQGESTTVYGLGGRNEKRVSVRLARFLQMDLVALLKHSLCSHHSACDGKPVESAEQ